MYTAFVNDCPLRFAAVAPADPPELTLRYRGGAKFLLQLIGTLEGGRHPDGAVLIAAAHEEAWADFRGLHKIVPAAGGAVVNGGRLLCIYRRGSWDLPKGKIDAGESEREAAVREVAEETGLREPRITRELPVTFHTYRTGKGKRIFKPTYWYEMASDQETLTPETEEDIEEARWIGPAELREVRAGMYKSLHPVVDSLGLR